MWIWHTQSIMVNGLCKWVTHSSFMIYMVFMHGTEKFTSSSGTVLQVYVCNSSTRLGVREVGMYDCKVWMDAMVWLSITSAPMKSSLCDCEKNQLRSQNIGHCVMCRPEFSCLSFGQVVFIMHKPGMRGILTRLPRTNYKHIFGWEWRWELESCDNVQHNLSITKSSDHLWKCAWVVHWVTSKDPKPDSHPHQINNQQDRISRFYNTEIFTSPELPNTTDQVRMSIMCHFSGSPLNQARVHQLHMGRRRNIKINTMQHTHHKLKRSSKSRCRYSLSNEAAPQMRIEQTWHCLLTWLFSGRTWHLDNKAGIWMPDKAHREGRLFGVLLRAGYEEYNNCVITRVHHSTKSKSNKNQNIHQSNQYTF